MKNRDHITVCICTYRRPKYLLKLLKELENQKTENQFDYSIVIVDNDRNQSAKKMVEKYIQNSKISIKYFVQPIQNIALTRNLAIAKSSGNFLGLIDDDEFPLKNWLFAFYKDICRYRADGMLGPVLPLYEKRPPAWVINGKFFDRPIHNSGDVLQWQNTRTGNALLKKEIFNKSEIWFNPDHGSGGEDKDFFRRKIAQNYSFVWCNEAPVFENVPPIRWNRKFMLKRALLRGKVSSKTSKPNFNSTLKSIIAILIYSLSLPILILIGQHIFMIYLIRSCDHLGKVLTTIGVNVVTEKYIT